MENTTYPALATAAFDGQTLRMKVAAEKLLRDFEASEAPKDFDGITRAARALLGLNRLIKSLYEEKKAARKPAKAQPKPEPEPDDEPETEDEDAAEPAEKPAPRILNRHERRRIAAQLLKEEKQRRMG